jgi:hypothetical protein
MNTIVIKNVRFVMIAMTLLLVTSCALKPIASEYDFVKTNFEDVTLEKLGNGKVLIYNGTDILHKIDNTARLNVWINGKALGQIKGREYVIVNLKKGDYEVKLHHIDVVNMRSTHSFTLTDSVKVIKIKPTITSNKLEITNEFPKRFEKFTYAVKKSE